MRFRLFHTFFERHWSSTNSSVHKHICLHLWNLGKEKPALFTSRKVFVVFDSTKVCWKQQNHGTSTNQLEKLFHTHFWVILVRISVVPPIQLIPPQNRVFEPLTSDSDRGRCEPGAQPCRGAPGGTRGLAPHRATKGAAGGAPGPGTALGSGRSVGDGAGTL